MKGKKERKLETRKESGKKMPSTKLANVISLMYRTRRVILRQVVKDAPNEVYTIVIMFIIENAVLQICSYIRTCWYVNCTLTLILLTWRIWWAPNNASKWQMGFNWVFKGLILCIFRAVDNELMYINHGITNCILTNLRNLGLNSKSNYNCIYFLLCTV